MSDSRFLPFVFNADLTDCLLTTLPDFQSLEAFISSSHFIYSVFRSRQNSVLGAVAHNQFGTALPQAMHLVRYLDGTHPAKLTREAHWEADFAHDLTITPAQARLLRDHAATVRELEDIYSWREKDPRFRSSRLSIAESLRFQQSLYRFWLLTVAYGPEALVNENLINSSKGIWLKDSTLADQVTSLLSLGETEFLGIGEAHGFLLDLARWALLKYTIPPTRSGDKDDIYIVWNGPSVALDAFKGRWQPYSINLQWYGAWRAMTHAFVASQVSSITGGRALSAARHSFILDHQFLETVNCSRCEVSSLGRNPLWSACNWEYMILDISPSRLANFLSFEKRRPLELLVSFTEAIESIPYFQLIEEIFDIHSERYRDWKKDNWLCTGCMTELLSDNIQTWFSRKIPRPDATPIHR